MGDTLVVEYTPAAGVFAPDDTLFWAGGFRGWRGREEDETLLFPMIREEAGAEGGFEWRVSVAVPEFATGVGFGFCDAAGFNVDLDGGEGYCVGVKFQKKVGEDGEVVDVVAGEGEEEEEEGVEEEGGRDLERKSASEPVLSVAEEETLHRVRGEATMAGEEAGLGSVFISQVRDVFDRFDVGRKGEVGVAVVGQLLEELGFDIGEERLQTLLRKYIGGGNVCGMTEFMLLYCELELADEGIDIV